MSLPYFPMFPSDFEAKTSHLTLEEDGAYNRLLRLCWMTPGCSLPDDDAWIMRRMRCDQETFDRVVRVVLDEFFTRSGGRVSNAKLSRVFADSNDRHNRRVLAGSKGGAAKARKRNENAPSNAVAKPKQPKPKPEPYTPVSSETGGGAQKRARRLPEDWRLPREWGQWALSEGWPEGVIRDQAERFKDHWLSSGGQNARKLDWERTWRNWMRRVPKVIDGGRNGRSDERLQAFIAGARGAS